VELEPQAQAVSKTAPYIFTISNYKQTIFAPLSAKLTNDLSVNNIEARRNHVQEQQVLRSAADVQ
jgi:hypothetical protein